MVNANADQHLFDLVTTLNRHLNSCRKCASAMRAGVPHEMCELGLRGCVYVAKASKAVIPNRIKVKRSQGNYVFPCPDTSAHGKAYSVMAPALMVTGVQDTLLADTEE